MRRRDKQNLALKEIREKRREKYASYKGGKRKPGEKPEDLKQTARKYFALLLPHVGLVPTAILSASTMLLAFLSLTCGLILDTVTHSRREIKRLSYLAIPAPNFTAAILPPDRDRKTSAGSSTARPVAASQTAEV